MIKKTKRSNDYGENKGDTPKRIKSDSSETFVKSNFKETKQENVKAKLKVSSNEANRTVISKDDNVKKTRGKFQKPHLKTKPSFVKNKLQSQPIGPTEKVNWNELKQQKKDLKIKRKKAKGLYEVSVEVKKIAEEIRRKQSKNKKEKNELINKLHSSLGGKGHYAKLVFIHDTARCIQYLLKFGSESVRKEISEELIPVSAEMLQSKYARYCFKNMLKYGNNEIRSAAIRMLYGNAVKLTSHAISAAVFEYAYSNWASPKEKQHLIQEFFGDLYKKAKDDNVKHLRDVYKDSPAMKNAALQTTKLNLSRIFNKDLLDSGLVQSVLCQYLIECSTEDRVEIISQLAPHVVVISNSKDGVKVAMQCIWHGSNKDRKLALKAIKEHVIELSKHEHGHCTIITLLDAADDTVLVNKMILSQILADVETLAKDEWGRKVILWLVAPANSTHFHPLFIKELEEGRQASTSKKTPDIRRKELLNYTAPSLLKLIASNSELWLSSASIAMVALAILKSGLENDTSDALENIAKTITDLEWKIHSDEGEIRGVEHPGLHMILKKLAQHDKVLTTSNTFGKFILDNLSDEVVKLWLTVNRACFLLIVIYENGNDLIQTQIKQLIKEHMKLLKKQNTTGAKILLKKLS